MLQLCWFGYQQYFICCFEVWPLVKSSCITQPADWFHTTATDAAHTQTEHTQSDSCQSLHQQFVPASETFLFSEYHYLPKLHQHFIEYTCPYCEKPTCHGSRSKVPFQHVIDWAVEKKEVVNIITAANSIILSNQWQQFSFIIPIEMLGSAVHFLHSWIWFRTHLRDADFSMNPRPTGWEDTEIKGKMSPPTGCCLDHSEPALQNKS